MVSSVNSTDGTYEQQCKHTKTLCKPRYSVSSPLWSNCIYHTKTIYIQCTYITHHITTRPTTCANPGVVFPLHCSRSFLLCRLTCCSNHGSRKLVRMLNSFLRLLLIESVGNLNFLLGAPTKEVKIWLELSIVLFEHFWVIQWYHFGSSI